MNIDWWLVFAAFFLGAAFTYLRIVRKVNTIDSTELELNSAETTAESPEEAETPSLDPPPEGLKLADDVQRAPTPLPSTDTPWWDVAFVAHRPKPAEIAEITRAVARSVPDPSPTPAKDTAAVNHHAEDAPWPRRVPVAEPFSTETETGRTRHKPITH
jgi:hypothetical protein